MRDGTPEFTCGTRAGNEADIRALIYDRAKPTSSVAALSDSPTVAARSPFLTFVPTSYLYATAGLFRIAQFCWGCPWYHEHVRSYIFSKTGRSENGSQTQSWRKAP
jgi:hypothetical protein